MNKYLIMVLTVNLTQANDKINWQDWSAEVFAKAKTSILLNVDHEGCIACRFMEQNTFSNPVVIRAG